jgi:hypothetical protein
MFSLFFLGVKKDWVNVERKHPVLAEEAWTPLLVVMTASRKPEVRPVSGRTRAVS